MLCHAKNGTLAIGGNSMDYISFGCGERVLVMLPGLSGGLKTVKATALPFAWMYRAFAKRYTVYVASRVNELPTGYTTQDTTLVSRQLGEGKQPEAQRNFSFLLLFCVLISAVFCFAGVLFRKPILYAMGANDALYPACEAYAIPICNPLDLSFRIPELPYQSFHIQNKSRP